MQLNKLFLGALACTMIVACQPSGDKAITGDVVVPCKSFPKEIKLDGKTQIIERNEPYVPGKAIVTEDGYWVYLYDSDYFISVTDKSFKEVATIAHKGNGPGEVQGVSGALGQKLSDDGLLAIFDPYTYKLYGYNSKKAEPLTTIMEFSTEFTQYTPMSVIKLKNGCYIAPRGDFKYGTIMYNPKTNATETLPIGLSDVNEQHPEYDYVSMRDIDYSEKNGVVAEIYGRTPTVILRDESGNVIGTIKIDGFRLKNDDGKPANVFNSIALTDDYIWLLYGDTKTSENSHVYVLTYSGEPVADYSIKATQNIAIDTKEKLIIAVDPNNDENSIVTYKYDIL
jgi:hypothetical protein